MKEKQIPWSLNSLGAFAGELMLKDEEYIRQTRRLILSEREKMYSALKEQPAYKTYSHTLTSACKTSPKRNDRL